MQSVFIYLLCAVGILDNSVMRLRRESVFDRFIRKFGARRRIESHGADVSISMYELSTNGNEGVSPSRLQVQKRHLQAALEEQLKHSVLQ